MRILFISSEYPPETGFGGVATYTRYAAETLSRHGHTVHVICRSEKSERKTENINGISVHRVPTGPYPLPEQKLFYLYRKLCYKVIPQSLHRLAWAKSAWCEYRKIACSVRFDIIEYPDCGAEGYYFRFYLPCVVRLHTPWTLVRDLNRIHEHPIDRILQAYLERFSIKKARGISSPSRALSEYLGHRWGLAKVTVYPNPIVVREFKKKTTGEYWLYTGRIEYRKGVHILLQAYASVSAQRKTPPLFLIGRPYGRLADGKLYKDYIQSLLSANNLQAKVTWIQGVAQEEIGGYLIRASAAFFPSLWENFPYSCLEAMAAGVTPCASDSGGYPEMIEDNVSGFLFKSGDSKSLAQRMNRLLDSPRLLRETGENARARAVHAFDGDSVYQRMYAFYNRLVENR